MTSDTHWYSFVLVAGATAIAVEIAGLRLLAPLFGSSLPVWGFAIAIVLAGLAVGYTLGGRQASERKYPDAVFYYAALGSAVFLWMPVAFSAALWLRNLSFNQGNGALLLLALALAYGVLFIPSLLFGLVSPLAVQTEAERKHEAPGQAAGRISTLSTVGSLLGILLPSFITIPFIGSRLTVWLFAGITLALCTKAIAADQKKFAPLLWLAAAGILATLLIRQTDPALLFAKETRHQYVTVKGSESERSLIFDGNLGVQSVVTTNTYTGGYWDYLASLPALLPDANRPVSVLVLGAAASATERQMTRLWGNDKEFSLTSVELDGELFNVAQAYFDPPARRQVTSDGRLFAARDTGRYDLIIIDVYARELTVPFHLATTEFFRELAPRLGNMGIAAMNINTTAPDTLWVKSLARTVAASFPHLRLVHVPHSCNYLLLASQAPIPLPPTAADVPAAIAPLLAAFAEASEPPTDGLLLTDDRSPTDLLGLAALATTSGNSCS